MFNVHFARDLNWVWDSAGGHLYLADSQDVRALVASGYAGAGDAVNRPDKEHIKSVGPIPRGMWLLDAPVERHPRLGPNVIPLEAQAAKTAQGRSGFFIYGDNDDNANTASRGCIVLNARSRAFVAAGYWAGIRTLEVV